MERGKSMEGPFREKIHSARNRVFWELRSHLRWSRSGYRETGADSISLGPEEVELERHFAFSSFRSLLTPENYRKNLWTLLLLQKILEPHLLEVREILEPGCQDFSRLPALRTFFRKQGRITGLELDPFPVLHDLHSRWDKAKYYLSLCNSVDRYFAANFFDWAQPADLICCFYPFVSVNPALAWGLPAKFGDPRPWIRSILRNLKPGGLLLVVHQGEWEEEEFDEARAIIGGLDLLQREVFEGGFYPLPHPACASVYRRF
jgi:SAM-dependent methyltransferase